MAQSYFPCFHTFAHTIQRVKEWTQTNIFRRRMKFVYACDLIFSQVDITVAQQNGTDDANNVPHSKSFTLDFFKDRWMYVKLYAQCDDSLYLFLYIKSTSILYSLLYVKGSVTFWQKKKSNRKNWIFLLLNDSEKTKHS